MTNIYEKIWAKEEAHMNTPRVYFGVNRFGNRCKIWDYTYMIITIDFKNNIKEELYLCPCCNRYEALKDRENERIQCMYCAKMKSETNAGT